MKKDNDKNFSSLLIGADEFARGSAMELVNILLRKLGKI